MRLKFSSQTLPLIFLGIGSALVLSSCTNRQVKVAQPAQPPAPIAPSTATATGQLTEASLRGKEFEPIDDVRVIHFEYDKSDLGQEARETLKKNAEYLRNHPELDVVVDGHCDQRGTVEYNLALGQRRAKAVRDYYIRLGVPAGAIATRSYGKERPLCAESTEQCWAQNRRAETLVRARAAADAASPQPAPTPQ